jgi:hypothetical protein
MSDIMEKPIGVLKADTRCQARECMDEQALEEYAEAYRAGGTLPPLDVFVVEGELVIVDGFHRHEAARWARVATLPVRVVGKGSMADAKYCSLGSNQTHGLRRTRRDKRRAVRLALDLDDDLSNREIAKHIGVSHTFVANCRSELSAQEGEQMEIGTQYETYAEEMREEADTLFAAGAFDSAKPAYEKAIALSLQETRAPLEERVRLCVNKTAPQKRKERIVPYRQTEHPVKRCTFCGTEDDPRIVVGVPGTPITVCGGCCDFIPMVGAAGEPARQTKQEEAA